MIKNYLAFGELLRERLREKVTSAKAVKTASEIAGLNEKAIVSPTLFVLYMGDAPADTDDDWDARITTQRWLVVVAVRNRRDQAGGEGVQDEAGPVIGEVINALRDWHPGGDFRRPRRIAAPAPGWTPGGFGYYPIALACDIINRDD